MRNHHLCYSIIILATLSIAIAANDDWSRFRGPNGTGLSESKNLPVEFGPEKNVVWKTVLPPGHSSPILSKTHIFVTAIDNSKLYVIALDRKNGKILWKNEVPRNRENKLLKPNNPASPSPVTDGENVYAFFHDFGLISFSADGKERWRMPLGPFQIVFGFGASPVIVDDNVILPCDQDSTSYLIAVDRNTGRLKWKVDRPGVISGYSTPIIYQPLNGKKQILIAESFQLSAYSPDNGERLWYVRGLACEMKSVPSIHGDQLYINGWGMPENQPGQQIYLPSFEEALKQYDADKNGGIARTEMPNPKLQSKGYFILFDSDGDESLSKKEWETCRAMFSAENGLLSIKLGGKGDMSSSAIQWKYQKPVPQVPSTLLYQGVLYMVNDSGILISFDPKTGSIIKQDRLKGAIDKYFASPVGADGKVYLVSQDGTVSVISAKGDWEILAVNSLGDEVFATPAIADDQLYVRTNSAIYCFRRGK